MTHQQSLSRRGFLLSAIGQSLPQNMRTEHVNQHQRLKGLPPIHSEYWTFTVVSQQEAPLILSYQDTLALPAVDVICALVCSNKDVPRKVHSHWRGISIQTLLDRFNIRAAFTRFIAADGYITGLPLSMLDRAILAYQMNGEPLAHDDGFPARLVVPGFYGYKMPKWITRLELTDTPPTGFWEAQGWSASGRIETTAVITSPQHLQTVNGVVTIHGLVYAGEQSLIHIEVSIDDGPWMPVPFTPAPRFQTTEWAIDWSPPAPGAYFLKARAIHGAPSTENLSNHQVVITVLEV